MSTTTNLQQQLTDLQQAMLADNRLTSQPLATHATQLVFGTGSPDASLMLIGEAPGAAEDKAGQPFVGAAGRLLDDCLASINLDRADIWITNLVKYRPPANRDPLPAEKALHASYLEQEIGLIRPEVIVALGRHAAQFFQPDIRISLHRGRRFLIHFAQLPISFWAFYHPAAALYNPHLVPVLKQDFQTLQEYELNHDE